MCETGPVITLKNYQIPQFLPRATTQTGADCALAEKTGKSRVLLGNPAHAKTPQRNDNPPRRSFSEKNAFLKFYFAPISSCFNFSLARIGRLSQAASAANGCQIPLR
ncbi:hypothetical protein K239x_57540 [Planctomycetes bacterium K23_9]|uniref:Uncharacterized protein n=1 Tax=Stieleria marina TaxID=1930275 RepID=A0A517P2X8_9BACT|nr:hypothetical protein K239x_57540 [Planctomycetes bacterium K23_9]